MAKLAAVATLLLCATISYAALPELKDVVVSNDDPLIYYHGRWDESPGTWWAGSGFKLNVENLKSLKLNLGNHTTTPNVPIAISIDYGPFNSLNVTSGSNVIPLSNISGATLGKKNTVVRINSFGWQNNRVNLESIELNSGATLLPYIPSDLTFQFIGDSLSAGQYLPQGVDQAWPFLTGEAFKAEHVVVAQPGITLTDIESYGNIHGMSFMFFKTEDDGYYYTTDHNYTTPWNFRRNIPAPNVIVLFLGANDNGQNVTSSVFVQNYLSFLEHVREVYPHQPFLIFTPWGWPQPTGPNGYYYDGDWEEILETRQSLGDHNTFLVNTTGWVDYGDVFPDNLHPTVAGHQKIAALFETWLKEFGIKPESTWVTPVF